MKLNLSNFFLQAPMVRGKTVIYWAKQ